MEFLRRTDGSATIEAVIILPFFLAVFTLVLELSLVLNSRAEVLRVVQDANRNLSIGRLSDSASAESYVEEMLAHFTPNADATSEIVAGVVTTSVKYPARDVMLTGLFETLVTAEMTISAQHLIENWEG